ncbi:RNA polymerase recycling motor HelD [Paenibacillus gansuensis]|uniref:RNA polymerase recycling motor HelD n=1 Tax=Paenibacillus gansuensis TaxID=306542 RepID=A0ABW5P9V6_9BACL
MSNRTKEERKEQERVDRVRAKLREGIAATEPDVLDLKGEVVDIRRHFWDEVTVNLSHPDDVIETHASLKQQSELLSERERSHQSAHKLLDKMKRLLPAPYFARIDFAEEQEGLQQVYIGTASFLDEEDGTFLVYDWRTPVASLYYDYGPGPAAYETPGGTVTGEMELKRQFIIRDGDIRFMFDTGLTIGDEILQQVLGKGANEQMKSIVATIQREQNRIIRNDSSRMLIVEGAAGSGKTSAVMQRVAYLLYKYRNTLKADQMVLFSPNPMFNSYVSAVLPELGEDNIRQTTFQDYLGRRLEPEFTVEDPYDQLEYELSAGEDPGYKARMSGIRFKSSSLFLNVLQSYKERLESEGMQFRPLRFRGRTLVSGEEMAAKFYSYGPSFRLPNRVELMKEWLLERLKEFMEQETEEAWVQEELNYLDHEKYQKAYIRMRNARKRNRSELHDSEEEELLLRRMVVDEQFRKLRTRVRHLRFVHVTALYRQLFDGNELMGALTKEAGLPEEWQGICKYTLSRLDDKRLCYEDAAPYLYLKELTEGFRMNGGVRHVLIDEAQDYTVFQFEFLHRLFPWARMTAVGDFNQAIHAAAAAFRDEQTVSSLYGEAGTERIRLTRSYRSTREIVEFTSAMVRGGEEIEPFNRSGGKPLIVRGPADPKAYAAMVAERAAGLRAEGFGSVAVICKTAAASKLVYDALSEAGAQELALVTKATQSLPKGTVVIPAYLAKGVEFDGVLIYDASAEEYGIESLRKLFYTACTRAMHRLELCTPGGLSPFLAEVPQHLYEMAEQLQPDAYRV